MSVRTTCPYCGVGCGLVAEVRDGRLVGGARRRASIPSTAARPAASRRGCPRPCTRPTGRPRRCGARAADERWRPAARGATVRRRLAEKLQAVKPEEIAFYISGQLLTEDYYAVNKLAKGFLGTNNVDSNSRLCMSSAVAGYTGAFGSDGPPPSYADIDEADVLLARRLQHGGVPSDRVEPDALRAARS